MRQWSCNYCIALLLDILVVFVSASTILVFCKGHYDICCSLNSDPWPLYVCVFQVIGLLDVFSPHVTLEEFSDVWVNLFSARRQTHVISATTNTLMLRSFVFGAEQRHRVCWCNLRCVNEHSHAPDSNLQPRAWEAKTHGCYCLSHLRCWGVRFTHCPALYLLATAALTKTSKLYV